MKGHGSKFPRKMEAAITALLSAKNVDEAARVAGISPSTLRRWMKLPEFERGFQEAKSKCYQQAVARLAHASVPAAMTLVKTLVDPEVPPAQKARSACYILDQTRKGVETEDLERRVRQLESTAAAAGANNKEINPPSSGLRSRIRNLETREGATDPNGSSDQQVTFEIEEEYRGIL